LTKFNVIYFPNTKFTRVSFYDADFNVMRVSWSSLENALVYDGATYSKLIKNFRYLEQFDDADNAYYRNKQMSQAKKSGTSWLVDEIVKLTIGYGVRPFNAIICGILIVLGFSLIYMILGMSYFDAIESSWITFVMGYNREMVESDEFTKGHEDSYRILMRWLIPAFHNQKLCEVFSILKRWLGWLTRSNEAKIYMIIEGLMGWIILSLFIVTLTNVIIRF